MFIYLFQSYVCHAFATGIEEIEQIGGQSAIGAEFEGIIVACGLAIYDVVRLEDAFPPYVIKGSPIVVVDAQFLATDTAVIDGCARSVVVAPALILRAKGGAPPTAYPLSRSGGEASIGPRDDVNGVLVLETETDLHTRLATNVPLAQYVRWFALLGNFTYTAAVSLSLKLVACKGVESATASHVVLARAVVRHVLCNLYPLAVLLLKSLLKLPSAQQLCVSGFDRLVDAVYTHLNSPFSTSPVAWSVAVVSKTMNSFSVRPPNRIPSPFTFSVSAVSSALQVLSNMYVLPSSRLTLW